MLNANFTRKQSKNLKLHLVSYSKRFLISCSVSWQPAERSNKAKSGLNLMESGLQSMCACNLLFANTLQKTIIDLKISLVAHSIKLRTV